MTRQDASKKVQEMSENAWLVMLGRVMQVAGIPLLLLLVTWQLNKQQALAEGVAGLGNRISSLEQRVGDLGQDPYHGQDAKRDFALRDLQINGNSSRITDLDTRVRTLEIGSARHR